MPESFVSFRIGKSNKVERKMKIEAKTFPEGTSAVDVVDRMIEILAQ
jgi:hypothetical protein